MKGHRIHLCAISRYTHFRSKNYSLFAHATTTISKQTQNCHFNWKSFRGGLGCCDSFERNVTEAKPRSSFEDLTWFFARFERIIRKLKTFKGYNQKQLSHKLILRNMSLSLPTYEFVSCFGLTKLLNVRITSSLSTRAFLKVYFKYLQFCLKIYQKKGKSEIT